MIKLIKGFQKSNLTKDPINLYNSLMGQLDSNFRKIEQAINSLLSQAPRGTATLGAGGFVTVKEPRVTNKSIILMSNQKNAGDVGALYIDSRVEGISFIIASTSITDTSLVGWTIIEPD